MFGLGMGELVLILLVLVLLFGAKRIPEIAKGLGSGIRTFKTELKGPDEEEEEARKKGERTLPEDTHPRD